MSEIETIRAQLADVVSRLDALEAERDAPPDEPWTYLVLRPHPWRRQLSIKGRNMTVGQLMSTVRANRLSDEQAADSLGLPLDCIREARAYYDSHRALIELEATEERSRLSRKGYALEPKSVPG